LLGGGLIGAAARAGTGDASAADDAKGGASGFGGFVDTGGISGSNTAHSDAGAAGTSAPSRTLVQMFANGPWYVDTPNLGMTVDARDTVYIADRSQIFEVQGTATSVYLSADNVQESAGLTDPTLSRTSISVRMVRSISSLPSRYSDRRALTRPRCGTKCTGRTWASSTRTR